MGIQEEIFEEFFMKLEEDEEFPNSTLEELKKLWENCGSISQDKIFKAIKKRCEDVNKD